MAGTKNVPVNVQLDSSLYAKVKRYASRTFGNTEGAIQSYIRMALTTQIGKDATAEAAMEGKVA